MLAFWKSYFHFLRPNFWTAVGAIGGALLGGLMSRSGQEDANQANELEAQRNREFQERMSNTAHQREIADLRSAGLNPILTATGGAGSSTPHGAQARIESTMEGSASAAREISEQIARIQNLREQNKQIEADTALKETQRTYTSQLWNTARAQESLTLQQTETENHRTAEAQAQAAIASSQAKGAELEGKIDETRYGEIMRYIDRAVRSLTGGSSAYRNMFRQR